MAKPTCLVDGCDRAVKSRGMCAPHYGRWRRTGVVPTTPIREYLRGAGCSVAGCAGKHEARGLCKKHYKRTCVRREVAVCKRCGEDFEREGGTGRVQVYCSTACRSAGWSTLRLTHEVCTMDGCGREHEAHGLCRIHYNKRFAYARRARLAAVESETIDPREIYERDGWRCGICRRVVDPQLQYPHPRSASLDHIVPISLGGGNTRTNVQCAHLDCNVGKGNRYAGQPLLVG